VSFPRYPKYKPSGVEWLGEVPEHWQVDRLKRSVASCKNGTWGDDATGGQDDVVCVRVADFDRRRLQVDLANPTLRSVPVKDRAGRLLAEGDLLLEKSGGGETSPVGFVVRWAHSVPAVCSNFVARLEPAERVSSSYWCYAHAAAYAVGINTRSIKQTSGIQNLDSQQYLDEPFLFPPLAEQRAIAAFLDRETAKIDALIAEQEKLIELLAEKRQAVISHAVTKGLDPAAPMKPSGVEWLGDVPAHWHVIKMKWVARMESGHTPDKKVPAYWEDGSIPWVSLNDTGYLQDHDYIAETAYNVTEIGIANSSAHLLPPRSVVFSRDATIGRCAITTREMAVSQHFIAWVCGDTVVPEYLLLRLRSMSFELERLTTGATLKTIGMPEVRTLVTPLPPRAEQLAIVEYVGSQKLSLDGLLSEAEQAIILLRERRYALISAAVTGQIDVRNAVPETAA